MAEYFNSLLTVLLPYVNTGKAWCVAGLNVFDIQYDTYHDDDPGVFIIIKLRKMRWVG